MHPVSASLSNSTDVNVSTLVKQDQDCKAIDGSTGELCGETEGLHILHEFRKLYENRIEEIDQGESDEFERVSMKLKIMSDWIKDLGEQNTMLVHTVEDLEQATCSRVKLLEEKLKQSSQIVGDNLERSNQSEEVLNTLSSRINVLQNENEFLQQKIEYLQSDISGLLELIHRVHSKNNWNLEDIKFFEIQPKDIPAPLNCICGQIDIEWKKSLKLKLQQLQDNEQKMIRSQLELERKIVDLTEELSAKDETINKYVSRLQCFCEKLKEHARQTNQIVSHPLTITSNQDYDIMLTPDTLESILIAKDTENKKLHRQLQDIESKLMVYTYENNMDTTNLRVQLEEKCNEVQQMENKVARLEKEAAETRDTLTTEIATLEKQNYHASIGNYLKDDLIKEMRKGLKQVTIEKMLLSSLCPRIYNPNRCVTIPEMESSRESFQQFPASRLLYISTQRKSDTSFLHDSKCTLGHHRKPTKCVPISKLHNGLSNCCSQSHSRHHIAIPSGRRKYLKNIDKKILQTAERLSPPCRDSNLRDSRNKL